MVAIAVWRVQLGPEGRLTSALGCDSTFAADTLCLDDLFVQHPALEGIDGLAFDVAGTIFAVANDRNAIVVVSPDRSVHELYRNPVDPTSRLRNGGALMPAPGLPLPFQESREPFENCAPNSQLDCCAAGALMATRAREREPMTMNPPRNVPQVIAVARVCNAVDGYSKRELHGCMLTAVCLRPAGSDHDL